ncbi:MAG: type II toxin-antitoxin system HigA family antitoxin [Mangrovibacterium sp.]
MAAIKTAREYEKACERMEELLALIDDASEPMSEKDEVELALISDLVADYEDAHHEVEKPTLVEVLKYYMYENNITQAKLSEILEVSTSRVSDYLTGKSEPTLQVGRMMNKRLHIDADIILGV